MKLKAWHQYLLVFVVNSIIALIAFGGVLFSSGRLVFCNIGDGLKNYFTLYTYVKQSATSEGILKYDGFNYPFGDYVYFTDNTPLFSIPFRWFCTNVTDVSQQVFTAYNCFIVGNVILAGLLVLYILRYLLRDNVIACIAACIIPWINIQVPRIWRGHYNLSFSSFILLAICLMILWYENRYHCKRLIWISMCMSLLCFVSFMAHGYYLAIVGVFLAAMLFFYGLFANERKIKLAAWLSSVFVPVAGIALALGLAHLTDGYLSLRGTSAHGYDWMDHKVRLWSLFTPYDLHQFYFPVQSWFDGNDERAAYLGNVCLYGAAILALAAVAYKHFRPKLKGAIHHFFTNNLHSALFAACILMFVIAMGEKYHYGDRQLMTFYNVFNPFFYLHKFTRYVEQFRSLGRCAWPVFYGFNFLLLFILVQLGRQQQRLRTLSIVFITLLGGIEVHSFVTEMRTTGTVANPLHPSQHTGLQKLNIDFNNYQAILPLPYYTAGNEVYEYTLDDRDEWSLFTFQLSVHSNLPLMAAKMSRTPVDYSKAILDLAAKGGGHMKEQVLGRMNDKPVLVAFSRQYILADTPKFEPARTYFYTFSKFPEANSLSAIDSIGDVVFYEWYPKNPARL